MRNPWPMALVLLCSAVLCVVWDETVGMKHLWLPVVGLVVGMLIWAVAYAMVATRLMEKIRGAAASYQVNHNLRALEHQFARWRHRATREARNEMRLYWALALIEHGRWRDAREVMEALRDHCVTCYEWMNYYFLLAEYAEASGNQRLAEAAKKRCTALKVALESGEEPGHLRATKGQCRRAFLAWFSLCGLFVCGSVVAVMVHPTAMVTDIAAGAFAVGLFMAPVTVGWGILWWVRPVEDMNDEEVW